MRTTVRTRHSSSSLLQIGTPGYKASDEPAPSLTRKYYCTFGKRPYVDKTLVYEGLTKVGRTGTLILAHAHQCGPMDTKGMRSTTGGRLLHLHTIYWTEEERGAPA